jgi:hypothetical protein
LKLIFNQTPIGSRHQIALELFDYVSLHMLQF